MNAPQTFKVPLPRIAAEPLEQPYAVFTDTMLGYDRHFKLSRLTHPSKYAWALYEEAYQKGEVTFEELWNVQREHGRKAAIIGLIRLICLENVRVMHFLTMNGVRANVPMEYHHLGAEIGTLVKFISNGSSIIDLLNSNVTYNIVAGMTKADM